MQHTFLCQPGVWKASGVHLDDQGRETRVAGTTRVRHAAGFWSLDGFLELAAACPKRYASILTVRPFSEQENTDTETRFEGRDADLGRMHGSFFRSGSALLCTGQSEDGRFVLSQCLECLDTDTYVCRSVLLENGLRVASWAVHLERAPRGPNNP